MFISASSFEGEEINIHLRREMTEDQIKHMVNRFLQWKLPEHFRPDAGISFKAE